MPRDYLPDELVDSLTKATFRTTLSITLGDGTPLHLATSDIEFGDIVYVGKLAPVGELNLELTRTVEGIELQISNNTLVFGQNLINTPNVLNNMKAVLGCYIREDGDEWHDVKIRGKIKVGRITREWVPITFKSLTSTAKNNGKTVASVFTDAQIPNTPTIPPAPVYDDLSNLPGGGTIDTPNERFYTFENSKYYGRNVLPIELNLLA